jgi:hypothetical protein
MDDLERAFDEKVAYRIAARQFESAFEACQKLSQEHRQLLLKEIADRAIQQRQTAPSAESDVPKVSI